MQPDNAQQTQREALQNHLKLKEKEITQYVTLINQLKKQNYSLQQRLENKEGYGRMIEL